MSDFTDDGEADYAEALAEGRVPGEGRVSETRTACMKCGMADVGMDFHPHLFCMLKKANPSRDPWTDFRNAAKLLGVRGLPVKPPQVKDLPLSSIRGASRG